MPRGRGLRTAVIDAGFAVADRLARVGLRGVTWRARRGLARLGLDHHTVEIDGLEVGGSLADHGTYLRLLAGTGPHPYQQRPHPCQQRLFTDAVGEGSTVLDCGAYIGLHTMIAARRAGSSGMVIAVEPVPRNVAALRENLAVNRLADRVEVIEAAASDRYGTAVLHVHSMPDQSAVRPAAQGNRAEVAVPCVPLDEALAGRRVDVAKIDVEGAEAEVLAGLAETLARSPGATVFLECHPDRLADAGVDPAAWIGALRERGTLELIDELRERTVPATDDAIATAVATHRMSFNAVLVVD